MRRVSRLAISFFLLSALFAPQGPADDRVPRPRLPEFTAQDPAHWINSPPLSRDDLLGDVVLVDVWTFSCWNCYRSFPWLRALERRFGERGLRIVGIHSPEFERERDPARVREKVGEFELRHPVMIDNDFAYWRALGNRYWPAFYLVDRKGRVRQVFVGETHAGDAQAGRIEALVEKLLAE
jgi:glutathione peroxidase-family protein